MERIDDEVVGGDRDAGAQEEMARKVDARDAQPGAASQFEVHDGEADGDARPAIEDLVQVAVSRIVVLFAVPGESFFFVKVLVERRDGFRGRRNGAAETVRGARAHFVEPIGIPGAVEGGILDARDGECGGREVAARGVQRARQFVRHFERPRLQVQSELHLRDCKSDQSVCIRSVVSSSRDPTTRSAARSSEGPYEVVMPTHFRPAVFADSMPQRESSTATQHRGAMPCNWAARA